MSYNVTVSGKEYEGIDKVKLPITGESGYATFYAASLEDFLRGTILEVFESDEKLGNFSPNGYEGAFNHGYAFCGQTALKKVSLTGITNIPAYCFDGCLALTDVNIPIATTMGARSCFSGCTSLEEITLPAMTAITMATFNGCTALKKVDLPVCKNIGGGQNFNNCSSLETLILRSGTMCTLGKTNDFVGTPIASGTGYIYVPAALVDSYKAATNWSNYAAQFRAIEDYPDICG